VLVPIARDNLKSWISWQIQSHIHNIFRFWMRGQGGFNYEKNRGKKSCETVWDFYREKLNEYFPETFGDSSRCAWCSVWRIFHLD
jgi:hypothetical protein